MTSCPSPTPPHSPSTPPPPPLLEQLSEHSLSDASDDIHTSANAVRFGHSVRPKYSGRKTSRGIPPSPSTSIFQRSSSSNSTASLSTACSDLSFASHATPVTTCSTETPVVRNGRSRHGSGHRKNIMMTPEELNRHDLRHTVVSPTSVMIPSSPLGGCDNNDGTSLNPSGAVSRKNKYRTSSLPPPSPSLSTPPMSTGNAVRKKTHASKNEEPGVPYSATAVFTPNFGNGETNRRSSLDSSPQTSPYYKKTTTTRDIFMERIKAYRGAGEKHRVLTPGEDDFEWERRDLWNHDAICTPCLILQPKTTPEVVSCIRAYSSAVRRCIAYNRQLSFSSPSTKFTTPKQRKKLDIPRLCIAGGRNSNVCMMDGAVVLDLSQMKKCRVIPSSRTAMVQGGSTVLDLDIAAGDHGLMAITGTSQRLGVVGTVLGGGIGYASRKHGLASDNVVCAEVVLADGRVVVAKPKKRSHNRDSDIKKQECDVNHEERNGEKGDIMNEAEENEANDIYWAICGGGGGVGVITAITLKLYPIKNAALISFNLTAPALARWRKTVLKQWGTWISGSDDAVLNNAAANNQEYVGGKWYGLRHDIGDTVPSCPQEHVGSDKNGATSFLGMGGIPREVCSQLILPTNSSVIRFMATSVDPEVIPQSEAWLEEFKDKQRKRRIPFSGGGSGFSGRKAPAGLCWSRVPGLANVETSKFGAPKRSNSSFRLVRYCDELQGFANEYLSPGNIFCAYKYAREITSNVIDVLVEATIGQMAPKNESRVLVISAGGAINDLSKKSFAFDSRDANFFITIEGRWSETNNEARDTRERKKTIEWVQWVCNELHRCEGVKSTAHPESTRDQVSRSGRSDPLPGWYNFGNTNGQRLQKIKKNCDPRNMFSLAATRISYKEDEYDGAGRIEFI